MCPQKMKRTSSMIFFLNETYFQTFQGFIVSLTWKNKVDLTSQNNWPLSFDSNSKWLIWAQTKARNVYRFNLKMCPKKSCSLCCFWITKTFLSLRGCITPTLYSQKTKGLSNIWRKQWRCLLTCILKILKI